MPQGGARARSGPAPQPDALRRERDSGEWVTLPADPGVAVPEWPLSDASARELALWGPMWARPQAVMWLARGQEAEVAMYVRKLTEAERPNAPVAVVTAWRQLLDSLGLSTPGLRANRWRIGGPVSPVKAAPVVASSRERFRVVPDDGA